MDFRGPAAYTPGNHPPTDVLLPPLWFFALRIPASSTTSKSDLCISSPVGLLCWTPACVANVRKLSTGRSKVLMRLPCEFFFSQRLGSGAACCPVPENNCLINFIQLVWLFKVVRIVHYQWLCLVQSCGLTSHFELIKVHGRWSLIWHNCCPWNIIYMTAPDTWSLIL